MRRLIWKPLTLLLPLLLGGCTEMAARWLVQVKYAQEAGFQYVHEVHELRRWIRGLCKESLQRSVMEAIKTGDEEALRELLAKHYPGLVTATIIAEASNDPGTILSRAPGCERAGE